MGRLPSFTSIALGALVAGCVDQSAPTGIEFGPERPPIGFAKGTTIRGGGFDGAGNSGPVGNWPPQFWSFPDDIGRTPEEDSEFHQKCAVSGHCAVGAAILPSFAGLAVPHNPRPNPSDDDEDEPSCCFAVISTTNFFRDIDEDSRPDSIATTQSAIVQSFSLLPPGGWRLEVDLAFLTGETTPGAQNDFASVKIRSVSSDGTVLDSMEVLRFEVDDPLAWKPGGCDSVTLGDVQSGYPRCTDWTPYAVDVSRFGGRMIEVEIRVGEGGPDNDVATSLAIDNFKFVQVNLRPAVGPISLSLSPVRAGQSVQATSGFTDGDATDKHRAVWDWGDGTSTDPANLTQGTGIGSVSDRHTYDQPGTYTIALTVIDTDRGRGTTRRRITVLPAVITAQINIRPHNDRNTVRAGSQETIAVALLGSQGLDVAEVVVASLRFGPARARPLRPGRIEDLNGDGFADLVTRYRSHETGIQLGNQRACLTGSKGSTRFRGCDAINVVS